MDDAAAGIVARPRPCGASRASSASIEGSSPRVKTGSPAAPVVDGAQVELGVDLLDDLLAADVLEEDVGVRGASREPIWVSAPSSPAAAEAGLLGADREGDLGMVLVGGAGLEIPDADGEAAASTSSAKEASMPQCARPGAGGQRIGAASAGGGARPPPRAWPARLARRRAGLRPARGSGRARRAAGRAGRRRLRRRLASAAGRLEPLDGAQAGARRRGGEAVVGGWRHRPSRRSVARGSARETALVIASDGGLLLTAAESKSRRRRAAGREGAAAMDAIPAAPPRGRKPPAPAPAGDRRAGPARDGRQFGRSGAAISGRSPSRSAASCCSRSPSAWRCARRRSAPASCCSTPPA